MPGASDQRRPHPLEGLLVLDLSDLSGQYCGKLLAELGARVILVEPPGGNPVRKMGPFYHDTPGLDNGLPFLYFNTSKLGITLDLTHANGRDIFERLAQTADVVLESYPPGYLDGLGIGYARLSELNPRLVMTSVTPFGQTGPHRGYKSSDLVAQATGGIPYRIGYPEDPPVCLGGMQTYHQAGAVAASGSLMALYARDLFGKGQHVDVSLQEAMAITGQSLVPTYDLARQVIKREGLTQSILRSPAILRCKDGYVRYSPLGSGGRMWPPVLQWMAEAGVAQDMAQDPNWLDLDYLIANLSVAVERIERFFSHYTKLELWTLAQERGIQLAPISTVRDVCADPHLADQSWFVSHQHLGPDNTVRYPGLPYRLSRTSAEVRSHAPAVGQDNQEVYERIGMEASDLARLKQEGVI